MSLESSLQAALDAANAHEIDPSDPEAPAKESSLGEYKMQLGSEMEWAKWLDGSGPKPDASHDGDGSGPGHSEEPCDPAE